MHPATLQISVMTPLQHLISQLPTTAQIDFHTSDVHHATLVEDIVAASKSPEPVLVCCCTGNGYNDDWIVCANYVYHVPVMDPDNTEISMLDLPKLAELNIPQNFINVVIYHCELLCFSLGDVEYPIDATVNSVAPDVYVLCGKDITVGSKAWHLDLTNILSKFLVNSRVLSYGNYKVTLSRDRLILSCDEEILYEYGDM